MATLALTTSLGAVAGGEVQIALTGLTHIGCVNRFVSRPIESRLAFVAIDTFGVVLAIDARLEADGVWHATTHGGSQASDRELFAWAKEGEERGAGEILFTSMTHDGTRSGYPCDTFARLSESVNIPIIASGGAGSAGDIAEVLTSGKADAALAASIFHFGEISIGELKRQLREQGICVRL